MIIFTDKPYLVDEIVWTVKGQPIVMNLSSLYSGYVDLTALITRLQYINNTGIPMPEFVQSPAFDIQFSSSVLNDPDMFSKLINIMLHCREGYTTIIMVQRDFYRDAVMESLIKLIQQRYGYNCWVVDEAEDVECLSESHFTPQGLLILDQDIQLYTERNGVGDILPNINQE